MKVLIYLERNSSSIENLSNFVNNNHQELYDFFHNSNRSVVQKYKTNLKSYIKKYNKTIRELDFSVKYNREFLALLVEVCAKLHLLTEFTLFCNLLVAVGYRIDNTLKAISEYSKKASSIDDFIKRNEKFLEYLEKAYAEDGESRFFLTIKTLDYYYHVAYNFANYNKEKVVVFRDNLLGIYLKKKYSFLDIDFIKQVFYFDTKEFDKLCDFILKKTDLYLDEHKNSCSGFCSSQVVIENSSYSKKLLQNYRKEFNSIIDYAVDFVNAEIGDDKSVFRTLSRGLEVLNTEEQLFQYIRSYAYMHRAKLEQAFEKLFTSFRGQRVQIIDWGCGQAFASSLLLDYVNKRGIDIEVKNITLIEPSTAALSRGMFHIEFLKPYVLEVKAINKYIDDLVLSDLASSNNPVVIHLFSNILDAEVFTLDSCFLEKISKSQNGINYFVCVSPNINDKRNGRLDTFYKYFDRNYHIELISKRDSFIGKHSRYEIIFKVDFDSSFESLL